MLRHLDIRDMLIIDRLDLEFQPGLNVLTGETGAGKSILLDALGFVLGWRGRAELVRAGAARGEVTAVFDLPDGHAARAVLEEAGFDAGSELILRRVNFPDGRKQAYVNDRRASGEVLRALSDVLVELHGQQDDRGLLNPRGHLMLLDAFAGVEPGALRAAWRDWQAATRAHEAAERALEKSRAEEDYLRHAVAELEALAPQSGEEARLDSRRRLMQAAARIREDVGRAFEALGPSGAEGMLRDATRWLYGAAEQAEGTLEAPLEALDRALNELAEAADGVGQALETLSFDPHELETTEERLFALRALARKHEVQPDELGNLARKLGAALEQIDAGADHLSGLKAARAEAEAAYHAQAEAVRGQRLAAAARLDTAMVAELAPLRMERALFRTELGDAAPGPDGIDAVAFTVATNPGAPAGPLAKIASGGELSRFLLALKVCLTGQSPGLTMIFDEIDRGVGGATADAVGRRLAALAEGAQVLVVTHSPQVAALGGHHWQVTKKVEGQQTLSRVIALDQKARIEEIARMVSGDRITEAARDAARELLAG